MRLPPIITPLFDIISLIKGMNIRQHDIWIKAINASYTLNESIAMVNQSALKGGQVKVNPSFMDLQITWFANHEV
jgi:hypothetical protein